MVCFFNGVDNMIEYVPVMNKRFLTQVMEKNKERFQIVMQMLMDIEYKEEGIHEYGQYLLAIKEHEIQLVTPQKIYIKPISIH